MPFKSTKQARFLANQHSEVFKKFIKDSIDGKKVKKSIHKSKNKYTEALA